MDISEYYDQQMAPVKNFFSELGQGVQNFWYNLTGQYDKTSSYKALMEREDTAYQRAAEDMVKAGLSKFGGVNAASSSQPSSNGMSVMDKISQLQQLKAQKLAIDENAHNLAVSKKLGIRTNDENAMSKISAWMSVLFGLNPDDFADKGGVFPYLIDLIKGGGSGSDVGAGMDAAGAAASSTPPSVTGSVPFLTEVNPDLKWWHVGSAHGVGVYKPTPLVIDPDKFGVFKQEFDAGSRPSDMASFAKILGQNAVKDVDTFMMKLLNSGSLTPDNLNVVANTVSSHYDLDRDDVVSYIYAWLESNSGDVVYRWD